MTNLSIFLYITRFEPLLQLSTVYNFIKHLSLRGTHVYTLQRNLQLYHAKLCRFIAYSTVLCGNNHSMIRYSASNQYKQQHTMQLSYHIIKNITNYATV